MTECYHCHGDGRDPDMDYLLECPICGGDGEIDLGDEDDDDAQEQGGSDGNSRVFGTP